MLFFHSLTKTKRLTATALVSLVLFIGLGQQSAVAGPVDDFVTTWKTDNPGTSNSTSITVPMIGGPYDVDWNNDGTFDEIGLNGSVAHDFGVSGTVTIRIKGAYDSIQFSDEGDNEKLISLDQWGTNSWKSMEYAFFRAKNLQIPAIDTPDLSEVTDMSGMFYEATLANPDTTAWNTSAVTKMYFVFYYAASANPDTSSWDTSAVTNMQGMFFCAKSANPDTTNWDTAAVTDMATMFYGATSADPVTTNWDTSAVTTMSHMFLEATSANPDTSGWDTSAVTDMSAMFWTATSAQPDTSGWDTSAVEYMTAMFWEAASANPDTSGWDTAAVISMGYMFRDAPLANPDTSGWDTSAVTDMREMFRGATSFNRDIGSWDISALKYATDMFLGTTQSSANYDSLLSGWNAQTLQPGVTFGGGNSKYCSATAIAARANMIVSDGWAITDGGQAQACPPEKPGLAPDLTPDTDTGISDSDDLTTDNTPDFYVTCSMIGNTITLYTDKPAISTAIGAHVCTTVGTEVVQVSTPLPAGIHSVTFTDQNGDGESVHSPALAITVDLLFSSSFEDEA